MKKTQQILATIISLIILNFFGNIAQAEVCTGNYFIDDNDTSGDIVALQEMKTEKKILEAAIRTKKDELSWHVIKNEPRIAEYLIAHASVESIKMAWNRVGVG